MKETECKVATLAQVNEDDGGRGTGRDGSGCQFLFTAAGPRPIPDLRVPSSVVLVGSTTATRAASTAYPRQFSSAHRRSRR